MIGVDEVGRGCLAGPLLVVAAREKTKLPEGLRDSKTLSRKQREELLPYLLAACEFGEGWVKPSEIDRLGLASCLRLGIERALGGLPARTSEEIILDGSVNYLPAEYLEARCLVDADDCVPIVSAASVYAKVMRDRYMLRLAAKYPNYSFAEHVGYGTPGHYDELERFGPLRFVHRFSFAPLKQTRLL